MSAQPLPIVMLGQLCAHVRNILPEEQVFAFIGFEKVRMRQVACEISFALKHQPHDSDGVPFPRVSELPVRIWKGSNVEPEDHYKLVAFLDSTLMQWNMRGWAGHMQEKNCHGAQQVRISS